MWVACRVDLTYESAELIFSLDRQRTWSPHRIEESLVVTPTRDDVVIQHRPPNMLDAASTGEFAGSIECGSKAPRR
jgi:hypothetical protein